MFKFIICICQPCRELFAPWCVVRFPNPLATGMTFTAVGEPDYMVRHNWSQQQQSPHWNLLLHSQSAPICTNTTQLFLFHPNAATRVNTSRFNNGINATSMTRVTPCNNYMYTISMQLKAANITNRQTQQYSFVWAYSLHCLLCKKAATEEAELLSINILLPIHEHYDHYHDEDGNIGYG